MRPEAQPANLPRIVIYLDDVRPGDVHRPGPNRLFCAVYWTLTSFPSWFRSGDSGWFLFTIYPRKCIDKLAGGVSAFFRAVIETFFPPGDDLVWNFESTGVRLPNGRGGITHFTATFAGLLADEKSLSEASDGNGSSSFWPCLWCSNAVGRCDPSTVRGALVHHTSSEYERLRPRSPEELVVIWDQLHAAKDAMNRTDFKRFI